MADDPAEPGTPKEGRFSRVLMTFLGPPDLSDEARNSPTPGQSYAEIKRARRERQESGTDSTESTDSTDGTDGPTA